MRRPGFHMARTQRRMTYQQAVLALSPTWYGFAQVPGGRLDHDPGNWDQTFTAGVGQIRTAGTGTPATASVSIAPGLGRAVQFNGDGYWTYPQIFAATLPFAVAMWFTEDATFDLSRSNMLSQSTSTTTYNNVDMMLWTGAGGNPISLTNVRSGGSGQDDGVASAQNAARVRAHHVAVVKIGSGDTPTYMALDGVPSGPVNLTCENGGLLLRVGGNTGGWWREWKGLISDVAIWGGGVTMPLPTIESLASLYGWGSGGSARLDAAA